MNMLYKHPRSRFLTRHPLARGFTLVELMVTIAIIGIFMAIAVPNFQTILQANRIQAATAEFQSGLALARAEAIKRGGDARVTLLPNSFTGTTPNWNSGFTVFYDTTMTANALAAPAATANNVLMQTTTIPANVAIDSNSSGYVIFNGLGRSILTTGAFGAATFSFGPAANTTNTDFRCMIMSATGRTRSAKVAKASYSAISSCPTY
jgi:type IV fimbrial biogenesis protein FimT